MPHGWLHLIPLHALSVAGEPFIVHRAVVYAPSAAVLDRALTRARATESRYSALVMGYTPNDDPVEREIFLGEAEAIARHFGSTPLLDGEANADALRRNAPGATHVHLSCHGDFTPGDPLGSPVALAGGNFTARDWMELQLRATLVTLSACRTGFSEVGGGDEIVGITRALLYAGATSSLVTLWSVNAPTTLKWMLDFYSRAWDNAGKPRETRACAFRQATLELRDEQADPYFWAPFVLVGDGS